MEWRGIGIKRALLGGKSSECARFLFFSASERVFIGWFWEKRHIRSFDNFR